MFFLPPLAVEKKLIVLTSLFPLFPGACFPILAKRFSGSGVPESFFFVAKFFGSGVIIATAFIHLLAPAHEAFSNRCVADVTAGYPWVEAIVLATIMVVFVVEVLVHHAGNNDATSTSTSPQSLTESLVRKGSFRGRALTPSCRREGCGGDVESRAGCARMMSETTPLVVASSPPSSYGAVGGGGSGNGPTPTLSISSSPSSSTVSLCDHEGQTGGHRTESRPHSQHPLVPSAAVSEPGCRHVSSGSGVGKLASIFTLEFGVVFHSFFIGLSLAVTDGDEFSILATVLTLHQLFEGLGLGARLTTAPWPDRSAKWMPYLFGLCFALSTPLAIVVGVVVESAVVPGSRSMLLMTGVVDAIAAGILIYVGLVELMAHEFFVAAEMEQATTGELVKALGLMVLGAGMMAGLGWWI